MNNKIHLIGNAHLDPTWLWRWQEGCGEVLQTFRSAVDRLNEYEDFVFTCSSACYYQWVEEIDKELFNKIVKLVKEGRWVPVNGWFVQPDCNMPSAESFARQALYSQLYYYEKFGKICSTGYNVDSFGHNAMMPQLLNLGGMRSYVMMRPDKKENPNIPHGLFWWDSADGSRVLTYRIPTGYAENGINALNGALETVSELGDKNNTGMMLFYGVGNHGGGPTKGDIEYLQKLKNEGMYDLGFSSPDEYFKSVCNGPLDIPAWQNEMQHHASGCYSATSKIKQLNRQAETSLINAEKWNTISSIISNKKYSTDKFKKAWLNVCYNQFHDILCGCSIKEAYDDATYQMGAAIDVAQKEENTALLKIADTVNTWIDGVSDSITCNERHHCRNLKYPRPVVVFNPLSRSVSTTVRTYHASSKVVDSNGNNVLFSNVRSSRSNDTHLDTVWNVELPPLGYATYWLYHVDSDIIPDSYSTDIKADKYYFENSKLIANFDEKTGAIKSVITKDDGVEHILTDSLIPAVFDNTKPDTWAHNIFKFDDKICDMHLDSINLVESTGVRAVIRVKHTYNNSYVSQDYILDNNCNYIRSKIRINWQEPLTIVKLPVSIPGDNPISTYEIPGGFIIRQCNGDEEPALTWGDVTANNNGISLISNAKYSYSCNENTLYLTVIRNSIFADHYSDRPSADFTYCDEGLQYFEYEIYPHSGYAQKSEVQHISDILNNKPVPVPVGYHKGTEKAVKSFINIEKDNIQLMSFKQCEDNSGDFIIRLRETSGINTNTAIVCNLINSGFWAEFKPQEIKTFRIDKDGFATETNSLEGIV